MQIIYLTTEGVSSSVFKSQVFDVVNGLKAQKINIKLHNYQKIPFHVTFKNLAHLTNRKITNFFYIDKIDIDCASQKIASQINSPTIFHCRGPVASYICLLAQSLNDLIQVIYDVRAAAEEEFIKSNLPNAASEIESINSKLFNSKKIWYSFISTELLDHYKSTHPINPHKVIICNSAYNQHIFNPSSSFIKKPSKNSAIYVGGNQDYQNIQKIVSELSRKFDKLIIVTTKKIKNITSATGKVVMYRGLSQKQIVDIIEKEQCSYGIIYRDNLLFNIVSTPTKISEYLGMGLKIVAINNAGAYTKEIIKNPFLGNILTEDELANFIPNPPSKEDRIKISEYALENMSQSLNLTKYSALYKTIEATSGHAI